MTTSPSPASSGRTRPPILRDRRNWIAIVVGLAVVVTGATLVWPQDGDQAPDTPDDLCAFIGKDEIAKYVPNPEFRHHTEPGYANCSAKSAPSGVLLTVSLHRSGRAVQDFAKLCRTVSSTLDRPIERSESAEFGDRMCGSIENAQFSHSVIADSVQGGDLIDLSYSLPPGQQEDILQSALEMTRLVHAKLQ